LTCGFAGGGKEYCALQQLERLRSGVGWLGRDERAGYQIQKFPDLVLKNLSRTIMIAKSFALAKTFCPIARKSLRDHGMSRNLTAWIPWWGIHVSM
jgi:hypothetical protein